MLAFLNITKTPFGKGKYGLPHTERKQRLKKVGMIFSPHPNTNCLNARFGKGKYDFPQNERKN